MAFIQRLLVLFYVTLVLFLSCLIVMAVLGQIDPRWANYYFYVIAHDYNLKVTFSLLAAFLIIINFVFFRVYTINVHRDKTIAFDNPSGRVTVSLFAIEDLIRRTVVKNPAVRDSRPSVTASPKGLDIKLKLSLQSEVNIPDVAADLQVTIVKKIQETIGIDESMNVSIYVGKIFPEQVGPKAASSKLEPNVPFRGYKA